MAQYFFGAGTLSVGGTTVGVLQDVSLDIDATTKELRGANKYPVDVANGPASIKGKIKWGQIDGALLGQLLGTTPVAGTGADVGLNVLTVQNSAMGAISPVAINWNGTYRGKAASFQLPACVIPKLALAMKNDDYTLQDADFQAFEDSSTGNVIIIKVAQ